MSLNYGTLLCCLVGVARRERVGSNSDINSNSKGNSNSNISGNPACAQVVDSNGNSTSNRNSEIDSSSNGKEPGRRRAARKCRPSAYSAPAERDSCLLTAYWSESTYHRDDYSRSASAYSAPAIDMY